MLSAVRAGEPTGEELLQKLLDSQQLTEIKELGDLLAEYGLSESQVHRIIKAAEATTSDAQRIYLWHSIRLSHDRKGREYLFTTIPKADAAQQSEFIRTLTNPSPFDVPLLQELYIGSKPAAEGEERRQPDGREKRGDDVGDALVRLATADWSSVVTRWRLFPKALSPELTEVEPQKLRVISDRRYEDADQAQAQLLAWLAKNGYRDEHRIDACKAALGRAWPRWKCGTDQASRLEIVRTVVENVKDPDSRVKLVAVVSNYSAPTKFLAETEPVVVRLAAVQACRQRMNSYRRSPSSVSIVMEMTPVLTKVAQSDPSPEVKTAAADLLDEVEKIRADDMDRRQKRTGKDSGK